MWDGFGGQDVRRPASCPPATEQVLQELVGDRSLERFRIEYEKLYRALNTSQGGQRGGAACGDVGGGWGLGPSPPPGSTC